MKKVISGFHAIEELIKNKQKKGVLYFSKRINRNKKLITLAEKNGYSITKSTDAELEQLSGIKDHRGIIFISFSDKRDKNIDPDIFLRNLKKENALVLVLDGITDPHNYGAIIRSADQFSVDLVIVPERRAAHESAVTAKVSAGANNYVPIAVVTNVNRVLKLFKANDFWIYGAEIGGTSVTNADLKGRTVLVLGSEGKGLSRLVSEHCDVLVKIPVTGHIDSLNVSVAAGILMYEVRRQQNL